MCGILGITIGNDEKKVTQAIGCFKYRGPDNTGIWSDGKVTLANVRLAVIDPQSNSNQPMFSDDGKIGVVFNGEIYNFQTIKNELIRNHNIYFKTDSDTEMILFAYKIWGEQCFEKFLGMFAICIYNQEKNKIILIRDHAGIKPLYYYFNDKTKTMSFSSEIKGILKLFGKESFQVNEAEILNLLTLGFIESPKTLYKDIYKLEKKEILVFDLLTKSITKSKFEVRTDVINKSLDEVLENSIDRHLVSGVPIGLFFSGGTDSSLIASYLKKKNIRMNAYSVLMPHKNLDAKYIALISKELNLQLKSFAFDTADFDKIYFDVMNKVDEPLYDASIFPTYFVSQKAKGEVKVVLSGEGGDEYFLGYERHLILQKLNKNVVTDFKLSLLDYMYLQTPAFFGKKRIFEKMFILFKKPLSYFLLKMSIFESTSGWKKFKENIRDNNMLGTDIDKKLYLENDLLRKIDFATSYSSLEGRTPLLDPEVIAFSDSLSDEGKLKNNVLKYELKKVLENYLPKEYIYRRKSGFSSPLSSFFKNSRFLKSDLELSINYFKDKEYVWKYIKNLDFEILPRTNPYFCFTLISLYYSLRNKF